MKHTKLKCPILRPKELNYAEFKYPIISRRFLPEPILNKSRPFLDVIQQRKSRRFFNSLKEEQLNTLLWHSARTTQSKVFSDNKRWEHRPSPSAGGRHPIDIFIINTNKTQLDIYLYQNKLHALAKLKIKNTPLQQMIVRVEKVIPRYDATIIWLGAQFDRTTARYRHGESLVWKDIGALTSTIALVSESLKLNCCPIGITGEPFFSEMFQTDKLIGVGGVYLGSR